MSKPIGVRVFRRQMDVRGYWNDPYQQMEVAIEVDVDTLMKRLAPKAMRNKSKKTKLADGIVLTVTPVAAEEAA